MPVKKELYYDIKAGTNVKDYSELKRSARTGTTGGTWHICVLDKKKAPWEKEEKWLHFGDTWPWPVTLRVEVDGSMQGFAAEFYLLTVLV